MRNLIPQCSYFKIGKLLYVFCQSLSWLSSLCLILPNISLRWSACNCSGLIDMNAILWHIPSLLLTSFSSSPQNYLWQSFNLIILSFHRKFVLLCLFPSPRNTRSQSKILFSWLKINHIFAGIPFWNWLVLQKCWICKIERNSFIAFGQTVYLVGLTINQQSNRWLMVESAWFSRGRGIQ